MRSYVTLDPRAYARGWAGGGASLQWAEGRFAAMGRRALRWNGREGASLEWAEGRFAGM